jgi:PilZ domain
MTAIATPESSTHAACPTVADAIESTLEWLDQQGCSGKAERRGQRRNRYRVVAKITYLPAGSHHDHTFEVATRNLSRSGLSFIHKTLIYPRQLVDVQLPLPDRSVVALQAKVV